ncbi:MAG: hypothetical protein NTX38_14230 [Methylobacter sp.]|nr:hypothetical protein [Methylobacter sp.]
MNKANTIPIDYSEIKKSFMGFMINFNFSNLIVRCVWLWMQTAMFFVGIIYKDYSIIQV